MRKYNISSLCRVKWRKKQNIIMFYFFTVQSGKHSQRKINTRNAIYYVLLKFSNAYCALYCTVHTHTAIGRKWNGMWKAPKYFVCDRALVHEYYPSLTYIVTYFSPFHFHLSSNNSTFSTLLTFNNFNRSDGSKCVRTRT